MRVKLFLVFIAVLAPQGASRIKAEEWKAIDERERTFHAAPRPLAPDAQVADWPCFLGPTHDGICAETRVIDSFTSAGPPKVWERKVGSGYASPVVAGGRMVYFHRLGDQETIDGLDPATGRLVWRRGYPSDYRDEFGYNDGPRATPTIAAGRVFTLGVQGELRCHALSDGDPIWRLNIQEKYGAPSGFFGNGACPLADGERLIVNVGGPGACVVAFDQATGRELWRVDDEWGMSYASPVPATIHGRRVALVFTGGKSEPAHGGLLGVAVEDGEKLFRFPWRAPKYYSVNASNPARVGDNAVLIAESYGVGAALLDIASDFSVKPRWTQSDFNPHFATPLIRDGLAYVFRGQHPHTADLACVDLRNGNMMFTEELDWYEQKTLPTRRGRAPETRDVRKMFFRGSLLWVDRKCFALGEEGDFARLEISKQGAAIVSRANLFEARQSWTPPIIHRGLLYVCQNSRDVKNATPPRFICYDMRAQN